MILGAGTGIYAEIMGDYYYRDFRFRFNAAKPQRAGSERMAGSGMSTDDSLPPLSYLSL